MQEGQRRKGYYRRSSVHSCWLATFLPSFRGSTHNLGLALRTLRSRVIGCSANWASQTPLVFMFCFALFLNPVYSPSPLNLWICSCYSPEQKSACYNLQAKAGPHSLCFCMACRLRMNFMFLNGWKIPKEEFCFMTYGNYMRFSVPKNKILLEHSHTCLFTNVCGYSLTTMAGSNHCNRDGTAGQAENV